MSQTQMLSAQPHYAAIKDGLGRHEGPASKSRKIALTGSGQAWREEEVRQPGWKPRKAADKVWGTGSISPADSPSEDAVQAYCSPTQQDGAGVSAALSPAFSRQRTAEAGDVVLVGLFGPGRTGQESRADEQVPVAVAGDGLERRAHGNAADE